MCFMPYPRTSLRALLASLGLATGLATNQACSQSLGNAGFDASVQDSSEKKPVDAAVRDSAWVPADATDPADASSDAGDASADGSDQ